MDLDVPAARQTLEGLLPAMSKPAQDATIRLQGSELEAVPSQLGYTINMEQTLSNLVADPARVLAEGRLSVQLMPVLPTVTDATPYLQAAQQVLANPPTVRAYDQVRDESLEWVLSRQDFAAWLRVEAGANGPQVGYDPAGIAATLDGLGATLGDGRYLDGQRYAKSLAEAAGAASPCSYRSATLHQLHHPARRYPAADCLESGDAILADPAGQPGMDPDALPAGQALTIPAKTDLLPLPVVPGKRIVISIDKQRLWAYENGEQVLKEVISTGMDRSPTQPGIFRCKLTIQMPMPLCGI